ncbi:hypothetical protein X801_01622, partial [Opisthorchis viverrini]
MIGYGTNLKSAVKGQRGNAYRYDNELNLDIDTFGWVAVHLDPDAVEAELNALYENAETFRKQHKLE